MEDLVSDCCEEAVRAEGTISKYYVCTECGYACDAVEKEEEEEDDEYHVVHPGDYEYLYMTKNL